MSMAIVTGTSNMTRSEPCRHSWRRHAKGPIDIYTVVNGAEATGVTERSWWKGTRAISGTNHYYDSKDFLGVVPAYAIGVQKALEDGHEIITCFHDDLEIKAREWDQAVLHNFKTHPRMGLCGFAGAKGLGHDQIYQIPYDPMQLARQDFRSNMQHAEAHGSRVDDFQWVACLDGFSQIGRREFWLALQQAHPEAGSLIPANHLAGPRNLFMLMQDWGIVHHIYDGALGAFASRLGWSVGLLPIACHHHGGQTAVSDQRYHQWADKTAEPTKDEQGNTGIGDTAFWLQAHKIIYNEFRDVLPIRVP